MIFRSDTPLPAMVAIDHREKAPYSFAGLRSPEVRTITTHLPTGDYSLPGFTGLVAVERKSVADLFATLATSSRRRRFADELARLAHLARAAVVVEASADFIASQQNPQGGRLTGRGVLSVAASLERTYAVPWFFLPSRREAERWVLQFLAAFQRDLVIEGPDGPDVPDGPEETPADQPGASPCQHQDHTSELRGEPPG